MTQNENETEIDEFNSIIPGRSINQSEISAFHAAQWIPILQQI